MCGNIIYCPELMCLLAQSRWQADFQTFTHVSFSPLHINAVFLRSKVSAAEHLQCSVEAHFKDISSDYCSIVQALLILLWISFFSSWSTIFTSGVFTGNKSIHSQKNPEKSLNQCALLFSLTHSVWWKPVVVRVMTPWWRSYKRRSSQGSGQLSPRETRGEGFFLFQHLKRK